MGAWFVALAEGVSGDEYEARSCGLGFGTAGFLGCGDEGGDEHPSVGSGVKPAAPVAAVLPCGVGAVYHYLFFERIPEQLEIAVCLVLAVVDCQTVDAAEEVGVAAPFGQAAGIVAKVAVERVQRAVAV